MWAFPGGKVDAADLRQAELLADHAGRRPARHDATAARLTAIATWRELLEETGGDQSTRSRPGPARGPCSRKPSLVALGCAARGAPHDFDTRFFLLDAA